MLWKTASNLNKKLQKYLKFKWYVQSNAEVWENCYETFDL